MKKLDRFLSSILVACSDVTVASLWISGSDYWKVAIPVALLIVSWKEYTRTFNQ